MTEETKPLMTEEQFLQRLCIICPSIRLVDNMVIFPPPKKLEDEIGRFIFKRLPEDYSRHHLLDPDAINNATQHYLDPEDLQICAWVLFEVTRRQKSPERPS